MYVFISLKHRTGEKGITMDAPSLVSEKAILRAWGMGHGAIPVLGPPFTWLGLRAMGGFWVTPADLAVPEIMGAFRTRSP